MPPPLKAPLEEAMRLSTFAAPLALIVLAAAAAHPALAKAPAARVGTVVAEKQPINPAQELVGRIEARERVDARARYRLSAGGSVQGRRRRRGRRANVGAGVTTG